MTQSTALDPASLVQALNWRYATKRFDPTRRIEPATWKALEEALVLTPSSFGLQPWKFVVVTDPARRKALREVSWGQSQVEEASHLVVFAARTDMKMEDIDRFLARISEVRGVDTASLSAYRDMMAKSVIREGIDQWAARQAYIAMGNFLTSAALLGVDACPMEGLDPAAYDRILGLEGSGYHTVAACPTGYRAAEDDYATRAKVRFPLEQVIARV